jgi:hypothetical protein
LPGAPDLFPHVLHRQDLKIPIDLAGQPDHLARLVVLLRKTTRREEGVRDQGPKLPTHAL